MDPRNVLETSPPGQENRNPSYHNFLDGVRRRRPQPTQIPMHCLQMQQEAWNQRKYQHQQFQSPQNGNGMPQNQQQQQQTFAGVAGTYPSSPQQQQQQQGSPQQMSPQYFQPTPGHVPLKLFDAARQGFSQFQRDFCGKQPFFPKGRKLYSMESPPKPQPTQVCYQQMEHPHMPPQLPSYQQQVEQSQLQQLQSFQQQQVEQAQMQQQQLQSYHQQQVEHSQLPQLQGYLQQQVEQSQVPQLHGYQTQLESDQTQGCCQRPMSYQFEQSQDQKPSRDFLTQDVKFDVDASLFVDPRPIVNCIEPGQREFKLFDDYNKTGADQIKNVYNVNTIDYCNAREICGKRLYPQSIQRWPVDAIAGDLGELKKQALTIPGRLSSTFTNILDYGVEFDSTCFKGTTPNTGPAGQFGVLSLARCLNGEGIENNKMGYMTFIGMNLHKLFKDIDRSGPVCPSFAGPLADRNHQLDSSGIGVDRGFPEYELLEWSEFDWRENYRRKNQLRIKRRLLDNFTFDTLIFIFYTFNGDALQLLAAQQLYNRGWRFHKLFQVWMCPDAFAHHGHSSCVESIAWVPGVYTYFDYHKWQFFQVELKHVNDGVLEGKPGGFQDALWE